MGADRAVMLAQAAKMRREPTEPERREEIARMLSGAAITDEARAQAGRLLEGV